MYFSQYTYVNGITLKGLLGRQEMDKSSSAGCVTSLPSSLHTPVDFISLSILTSKLLSSKWNWLPAKAAATLGLSVVESNENGETSTESIECLIRISVLVGTINRLLAVTEKSSTSLSTL